MLFENRIKIKLNSDVDINIPDTISESKVITEKKIMIGFFSSGKTESAKKNPDKYFDMDESEYHWETNSNNEKVVNRLWPSNYIDEVLKVANDTSTSYKYILIPSYKELITELDNRKILYSIVIPRSEEVGISRSRYTEEEYKLYMHFIDYSGSYIIYESDLYIDQIIV